MTDIAARLRSFDTTDDTECPYSACEPLMREAADEVERLETDCDRLREFNTRLCAEIERLRSIIREAMFELLIAQEDNQMTSAAYRGEWLGELIETCQRGLENREAPR